MFLLFSAFLFGTFSLPLHSFFDSDGNYGYFAQFTDAHIQDSYLEGSDPDCDRKKFECCCFAKSEHQKNSAGYYGYVNRADSENSCDVPYRTFEETVKYILAIPGLYNISLTGILFTGDIPPHTHHQTQKGNLGRFESFFKYVASQLNGTEIKFFPSLGNHDSWPKEFLDYPGGESDWLYRNFSLLFEPFLTPAERKEFLNFGSFSSTMFSGIRVITLNSNLMSPVNPAVKKATEMQKELIPNYFRKALEDAKTAGERVILQEHIPQRHDLEWTTDWWQSAYQKIVSEFQDIIILSLTGHFHLDYPTMVLDSGKKPVLTQLTLGSLPPWDIKVQPEVRFFKVNLETSEVEDFVTIYNDVDEANETKDMFSAWKLLYTARDYFELKDLSPQSWWNFLESLPKDKGLYEKFLKAYHVDYLSGDYLSGKKKKELICSMKYVSRILYDECVVANGPLVS